MPAAPSNCRATAQPNAVIAGFPGSGKILVEWDDNSADETGFKIERAEQRADLTWTAFVQLTQVGQNVKSYTNIGLKNLTAYRYRVRAYSSSSGNSAYSNTAEATTL